MAYSLQKLIRWDGGLRAQTDFDGMKLGLSRRGLHHPTSAVTSRQLRRMDEREERRKQKKPRQPQRGF